MSLTSTKRISKACEILSKYQTWLLMRISWAALFTFLFLTFPVQMYASKLTQILFMQTVSLAGLTACSTYCDKTHSIETSDFSVLKSGRQLTCNLLLSKRKQRRFLLNRYIYEIISWSVYSEKREIKWGLSYFNMLTPFQSNQVCYYAIEQLNNSDNIHHWRQRENIKANKQQKNHLVVLSVRPGMCVGVAALP